MRTRFVGLVTSLLAVASMGGANAIELRWKDLPIAGQHVLVATAERTVDVPESGFMLTVPSGWVYEPGDKAWKLRNQVWVDGGIPDDMLSVSVSLATRTTGSVPDQEFRKFVQSFAERLLHGGSASAIAPVQMGSLSGLQAIARGTVTQGGNAVAVQARILLFEVGNEYLIASAIAPTAAAALLGSMGNPGAIFGPSPSNVPSVANPPSNSSVSDSGQAPSHPPAPSASEPRAKAQPSPVAAPVQVPTIATPTDKQQQAAPTVQAPAAPPPATEPAPHRDWIRDAAQIGAGALLVGLAMFGVRSMRNWRRPPTAGTTPKPAIRRAIMPLRSVSPGYRYSAFALAFAGIALAFLSIWLASGISNG